MNKINNNSYNDITRSLSLCKTLKTNFNQNHFIMKKLFIAMLLLPMMVMAQTFEKGILTMSTITVKQGHRVQFEDGVKKWKACMLENGSKENWDIWSRVQGEGTVYGLTGIMANWAEMDKEDEAGKSCASIVTNFIMPHIEKTSRAMATTVPDWSKKTMAADTKLVWASYFRVKNGMLFSEVVKDVSATLASKEGNARGQWYRLMGGSEHEADYMVVDSYNGYAALDVEIPGAFEVYESVHGKKKTEVQREKWRNAVDTGWSYIWEHKPELSN
jgi:hypothetical protein